jgi:hypothetical protein
MPEKSTSHDASNIQGQSAEEPMNAALKNNILRENFT